VFKHNCEIGKLSALILICMLKHCAANRKRRLSAFPNVGPYINDVKFVALQGAPYIYDISRLRVK
jgi:hypothetical protein